MVMSWFGRFSASVLPEWVVVLLALVVMWPGLVGIVHRVQHHLVLRMVLRESRGCARIHTEHHRVGGATYAVDIDYDPDPDQRPPVGIDFDRTVPVRHRGALCMNDRPDPSAPRSATDATTQIYLRDRLYVRGIGAYR